MSRPLRSRVVAGARRRSVVAVKAVVEKPVADKPIFTRIKRVRVGGKIRIQPNSINGDDQTRMDELLKLISIADNDAVVRAAQRKLQAVELLRLLKMYKLPRLVNAYGVAEIIVPQGRAVNTIDPHRYRLLVTDDEFLDSIKVGMEAAKKVLSERQILEITDRVSGKKGDPVLEVTPTKAES